MVPTSEDTPKTEKLVEIQGKFSPLPHTNKQLTKFETHLLTYQSCSVEGKYSFIGNGTGKGKNITFAEAWKGK